MADKIKPINLLPQRENFVNQFLSWALTIGRLLIILTETLALGTFLYRFQIDMRIIDLHDNIKNQRIIVSQFKSTEDQVRNLQQRLTLAQQYAEAGKSAPTIFSDIIDMGRNKVTFKNIAVSTTNVRLEVQASNASAINLFVNSLKTYPKITSVRVDNVQNRTSNALIVMTITANLKNEEDAMAQSSPGDIPAAQPALPQP